MLTTSRRSQRAKSLPQKHGRSINKRKNIKFKASEQRREKTASVCMHRFPNIRFFANAIPALEVLFELNTDLLVQMHDAANKVGFKDREWNGSEKPAHLFNFLYKSLEEAVAPFSLNMLQRDGHYKIEAYYSYDSTEFSGFADLSFLPKMKEDNPGLHDLVIHMIALFKRSTWTNDWTNGYVQVSEEIEMMIECAMNDGADDDILKFYEEIQDMFESGIVSEYYELINNPTISLQDFIQKVESLKKYPGVERLIEWFELGIRVIKSGFQPGQWSYSPVSGDEGECDPIVADFYHGFFWCINPDFDDWCFSRIDSDVNEYGAVGFVKMFDLNSDVFSKETPNDPIHYHNFMTDINEIFY